MIIKKEIDVSGRNRRECIYFSMWKLCLYDLLPFLAHGIQNCTNKLRENIRCKQMRATSYRIVRSFQFAKQKEGKHRTDITKNGSLKKKRK